MCRLTTSYENFVCAVFVSQLWGIAFSWFLGAALCQRRNDRYAVRLNEIRTHEFDGYLLIVEQVCAFEDDAK